MMSFTKDQVEEMVPSDEEIEKEEEGETEEEETKDDETIEDEEEEEDGKSEDQEDSDDQEKDEVETATQVSTQENIPSPTQPSKKKQAEGLNLNNEVVKMRKEVKRLRVLIIRKLTRQIAALKKKKAKGTESERNQKRAARLLEEIHAMKNLSPDLVTKTALQRTLNFDKECRDPKSTISDRAIARIATHPQFNKKIEAIKAAVKAFKEERMKGGKESVCEKVQNKVEKVQSLDKKEETRGEKEENTGEEEKEPLDNDEEDAPSSAKILCKDAGEASVAESGKRKMPKNVVPAKEKSIEIKGTVKKTQIKTTEHKPTVSSAPQIQDEKKEEEESDLELSDDEDKVYFDDSTEERFHKQSSQSEESEDDFFVGKVSKFKKIKKKEKNLEAEKGNDVKVESTDPSQSKLDELETRLKGRKSFESVFCSTLSGSKPVRGRGASRGRGGDRFRGRGKPRGGSHHDRDFSRQSDFQKQGMGKDRNPGPKSESSERGFHPGSRGRGRGRGDTIRQNNGRGGGVFSHQAPQQALHPSWEASKKRKEQQGQILAFQGKKIKFDDDD